MTDERSLGSVTRVQACVYVEVPLMLNHLTSFTWLTCDTLFSNHLISLGGWNDVIYLSIYLSIGAKFGERSDQH